MICRDRKAVDRIINFFTQEPITWFLNAYLKRKLTLVYKKRCQICTFNQGIAKMLKKQNNVISTEKRAEKRPQSVKKKQKKP